LIPLWLVGFEGYLLIPLTRGILGPESRQEFYEAMQATSLLNISNLARASGIASTTLKRYLTLLEATFLIHLLPAWSGNVRKRLIRTPKVLLTDSGLLSYLLDVSVDRLQDNSTLAGPLLENFVGVELLKQMTWNSVQSNLFYYRTSNGREVDYVIETITRGLP